MRRFRRNTFRESDYPEFAGPDYRRLQPPNAYLADEVNGYEAVALMLIAQCYEELMKQYPESVPHRAWQVAEDKFRLAPNTRKTKEYRQLQRELTGVLVRLEQAIAYNSSIFDAPPFY